MHAEASVCQLESHFLTTIGVAPIGARGPPPPVIFMKAQIFFFQISFPKSKLCTVLQYYQCTLQCTLRKLQCKSKLTNTVCANVFTITVCTVHVLYKLCSISMYTYNRILYSYYNLQQVQNTVHNIYSLYSIQSYRHLLNQWERRKNVILIYK